MRTGKATKYRIFSHIHHLTMAERIGFIIAFLILVGFCTLGAYFQWHNIYRDRKSYIELIGQSKITQLTSWYDSQMREAQELSTGSVFKDTVRKALAEPSSQNIGQLDEYLKPIHRAYNYADSAVLSTDFRILVSLTRETNVNCTEVRNETSHRKDGAPFFTALHIMSPSGKPGFHLIIPLIEEKQNEPFAYVVQTFFADDYLYPMLSQWPDSYTTGETLLLRRSNNMVQTLNPLKLVHISAFSLQVPINRSQSVEAQAGMGGTGVLRGRDYRGKWVIAVADQMPEFGWIILSKIDLIETISSWIPTLVMMIVFILVALAAVFTLSYILFSTRAFSAFQTRLELLKRTERSEALLSAIFERVESPVVIIDASSAIQFSNRAFKDRFQNTLPGALAITPEHREPDDTSSQTYRLQLNDSKGNSLQLYIMPIHIMLNSREPLLGYVMRDVTELESALEEVRRLNKGLADKVETQTKSITAAKEELHTIASAISHDLSVPLHTLESYSERLASMTFEQLDAESSDYVIRIRQASMNMVTLTDDLVTFLSLDSVVPAKEEFDFSIAAQEITSDIIRRNPKQRYQITIMPGLKMRGDSALLKTAFRNVIENAFLSSSMNMIASIEIGKYGDHGIFVKDNGTGMSPQAVNAILRPLSANDSESPAFNFNAGLLITKKIVELHGGSMEIESAKSGGTTIRFKF